MKKLLFLMIAFVSFFMLVGVKQVSATSESEPTLVSTTTETLEDGSYIVTEIYETTSNTNSRSNLYNKTGNKIVTKYSALNVVMWEYTLTASFVVDEGVDAMCSNAGYNYDIKDFTWEFYDGESSWVRNVARGVGTFECTIFFVSAQIVDIDITITCDEYGNLT